MSQRIQIGKVIKQTRKEKGWTQKVLAERAEVHKTTISEIENARFTGSFLIFERLLDALELQFCVEAKSHRFPTWDELDTLFLDDD